MKAVIRRAAALCLAFAMLFAGTAAPARAATISATKEKISELEKKKKSLQSKLKSLESEKDDILKYISKLDEQLTELENDLADTEEDIAENEDRLEVTRGELAEAEEDEKTQYANMKSRIKFIYETGGSDYVSVLLGAADFSDLLNRTEYIEKISEYDKTMLDRYIATKHLIQEKKAEIEQTLQELEDNKAELEVEEEQVQQVREKKESELRSYQSKIASTEDDVKSYASEIAEQEELLEKLVEEEKKRQEEEERKRKAAEEAKKKAEEEAKKKAEESKKKADTSDKSDKSDTSDKSDKSDKSDSSDKSDNSDSGKTSASGLRWPLKVSGRISSKFGRRSAPTAGASTYHRGIDIAVGYGTEIVAAGSGTVLTAAYNSAMGNYVVINHGGGLYTYYEHCSRFAVSKGDSVSKGEVIAYVGSTGISTNPHLHFGVHLNGSYVNPLNYVSP